MNRTALFAISVFSLLAMLPACYGATKGKAIDKHVAVLIKRMVFAGTEQKAFSDLEALGCAAVPAIIRRMDDRRALPVQNISLPNNAPFAYRKVQHYGVVQVADALAVILNQLTDQDFWTHKGITDEERTRMIQGWRKFLQSTPAPDLCNSRQAIDYTLDNSSGQLALYQADGYLSFVPPQFMVQSLEELERRIAQLPQGSKLHLAPYRRDESGNPILFSGGQFDQFAKFCRAHKIELSVNSSSNTSRSGQKQ